jgi:hypothetical protein
MKLSASKTALTLGLLSGLWHVSWALLVSMGLAQKLLDAVYRVHFMNNPITVAGFSIVRAGKLVVLAFAMAYAMGWIFALLWNMAHGKK